MRYMELFNQLMDNLWITYKYAVVILVTVYLLLFFIVGGDFELSIRWENVGKFWTSLSKYLGL